MGTSGFRKCVEVDESHRLCAVKNLPRGGWGSSQVDLERVIEAIAKSSHDKVYMFSCVLMQ